MSFSSHIEVDLSTDVKMANAILLKLDNEEKERERKLTQPR